MNFYGVYSISLEQRQNSAEILPSVNSIATYDDDDDDDDEDNPYDVPEGFQEDNDEHNYE